MDGAPPVAMRGRLRGRRVVNHEKEREIGDCGNRRTSVCVVVVEHPGTVALQAEHGMARATWLSDPTVGWRIVLGTETSARFKWQPMLVEVCRRGGRMGWWTCS